MPKTKKAKSKPESAETQGASSADKKTPAKDSEDTVSKDVKKPESEVEEEWANLKGSTQDRIVQLVRRAKAAETELAKAQSQPPGNFVPQDSKPEPSQEDVKQAVKQLIKPLKDEGVVTKEEFDSFQNRMYLDYEHNRLKSKYAGSDGGPKYIPEEVEDHARTHGFGGNLEAAYSDLYRDELIDLEIKKRGYKKPKTYTEKPGASVKLGEEPLSIATLRKKLRNPDGSLNVDWWAKNKDKIEPLLGKLAQK